MSLSKLGDVKERERLPWCVRVRGIVGQTQIKKKKLGERKWERTKDFTSKKELDR